MSCHRARTSNQHKTTKKTKQTRHNPKTARPVISWSVHRHLKRIRRDDNIVSPLGLVMAKENKSEQTKTRKCHTAICEPGSNKGTMRNRGSPQPGASRSQSASRRGQHSHRFLDTIQKPAMTLPCGKGKLKLNIVKRGVKTDLR